MVTLADRKRGDTEIGHQLGHRSNGLVGPYSLDVRHHRVANFHGCAPVSGALGGELRLSLWLSFFGFFSLSAWTICFAPPASTTSPIAEAKRSRDMFILHRNSGNLDWLMIS